MKLAHAFFLSVGLHAAALLWVAYGNSHRELGGVAKPPVSALQARLFTYQAGAVLPDAPSEISPAQAQAPSAPPPAAADTAAAQTQLTTTAAVPADAKPAGPRSEAVLDSTALDVSPSLVSDVTLEYPASAHNREGLVTLAIVVTGNGAVEDVSVIRAVPAGYFEAAAIAGFKAARFSPGLLGGLGVKSRMVIEVEFMPTNRGGTVAGQR